MCRVRGIDSYQYLMPLSPFKELQGNVRAVAVDEYKPPLPPGFVPRLLVKETFEPFETNLVSSLATRRRREPSVVFVRVEILDP
jgi:hypothetical protein